MIKKLYIENFKCFEKKEIEFRNLTILTGENSSGKSSLIQALLFLGNPPGIIGTPFNGDLNNYLQSLGSSELLNKFENAKQFYLKVEFEDEDVPLLEIIFSKHDTDKYTHSMSEFKFPNPLTYPNNLTYLNADRVRVQQINQYIENINQRYFGINGALVANYFEHNKRKEIWNELIKDETSYTLETQVNYWLRYITDIQELEFTTEKVSPMFVKAIYKHKDFEIFPENIGTGVSYLFTILVVCLSANKGNIIIIENPEIHLHPKAQARLGEFFAFIANKGVQLIIETHNDHIINKIRYEVYKNKLDKDKTIFYYFRNSKPQTTTLYLDNTGHWIDKDNKKIQFPLGFFDATLDELLEIG